MNTMDDTQVNKTCFKYKEQLFGSLNIAFNDQNKMCVVWNKYQIFLHEDLNFEEPARILVPEFHIQQIIISNNHLVCMDSNGNIHVTSLKFKNSTQKRFKSSFQPREQGILHCIKYNSDCTLSLTFEFGTYFLCFHKINSEFNLVKKIALINENDSLPVSCKIITCQSISKDDFEYFKKGYNVENDVWNDHNLLLISFDKLTVYACLFSYKAVQDTVEIKKLYTSPVEICDIKIFKKDCLSSLIALTTGTLVVVPLIKANKERDKLAVHLNTALSKLTMLSENSLIYTDGKNLWKSENTFSKENIQFSEIFVKDIKDFVKIGNQMICTTYTNLIYVFGLENSGQILKSGHEYHAAEKLLNNSEYLHRIMQELERNKDTINKINEERNYLTALSLSKRQDVMDTVVHQKVVVFDNYENVVKETSEIMLTEELKEYFKLESLLFLVTITTSNIQHSLSSILSNLLGDLKIHITFISEEKILKTTSINITENFKKAQYLIPLDGKNITQVTVEIKLVSRIPGALDKSKTIWTILHKKLIPLNAEHFIKISSSKNHCLKHPNESIEELVQKTAVNQHGNLFNITSIPKSEATDSEISFYVKLPDKFKDILSNLESFKQHFNSKKAEIIQKQLIAEEFLKSKSILMFEIGNEKVRIKILNDDFCNPLMKVSGTNPRIAFDIRNYFAGLFYNNFEDYHPEKEFISNALYTSAENLQRKMKKCIIDSSMHNREEIPALIDEFLRNIIGALPL